MKSECPLNNECLSDSLVDKATVSQTQSQISKHYYETCENIFKEWSNNHTTTFRNKSKQKSTELSKHIWELKWSSIQCQISWHIASRTCPYTGCTRNCKLCLTEKFTIPKADPSSYFTLSMSSSLNAEILTNLLVNTSNHSTIIKFP